MNDYELVPNSVRKWMCLISVCASSAGLLAMLWCQVGYGKLISIYDTPRLGLMILGSNLLTWTSLFLPATKRIKRKETP